MGFCYRFQISSFRIDRKIKIPQKRELTAPVDLVYSTYNIYTTCTDALFCCGVLVYILIIAAHKSLYKLKSTDSITVFS